MCGSWTVTCRSWFLTSTAVPETLVVRHGSKPSLQPPTEVLSYGSRTSPSRSMFIITDILYSVLTYGNHEPFRETSRYLWGFACEMFSIGEYVWTLGLQLAVLWEKVMGSEGKSVGDLLEKVGDRSWTTGHYFCSLSVSLCLN